MRLLHPQRRPRRAFFTVEQRSDVQHHRGSRLIDDADTPTLKDVLDRASRTGR